MLSPPALENLKTVDPDRCRTAVFAQPAQRSALLLLYGFHAELAKVPEFVSEPMIGQIRYQWWRDAVAEIYEGRPVRQHEITTPLAALLKDHQVPRFWVERLIDARERDLDAAPFADLAKAREYCQQTSGTLMQIAVHILGGAAVDSGASDSGASDSLAADSVVKAGEVWGLTGLLRGWEFYEASMLSEISHAELRSCCAAAYTDLRGQMPKVPAALAPALLYITLVPGFLKRHAARPPQSYSRLSKQSRLLRSSFTGKLPAVRGTV